MTHETRNPLKEILSFLKEISKLIGAILLGITNLVILATAGIFLNHLVIRPLHQMWTPHVGDLYKEKYTITEVIDEKITMVADNTNHVLYDVMRDSWGSSYLMIHLDENGTPMKQIEPIVSERPQEEPLDFLSDFDLKSEIEDEYTITGAIFALIAITIIIYIVVRCHEELEWRREDRRKNTHTLQKSSIDNNDQQ